MPPDSTRQSSPDDLQFDHAVHTQAPNATDAGPVCAMCNAPLRTEYFHVAEQPACANCTAAVERANQKAATHGRRSSIFLRAFIFGLVAAIAGAILYYAVIALTGWEIGLVAIVIGFMVGFAVHKGSGSAGGRRFQWLAVILTYFAVGLAYAPLAFKSFAKGDTPANAAVSDSVAATASTNATDSAGAAEQAAAAATAQDASTGTPGMAAALGVTFLFIFALPVIYVVQSLPSGLISAIIILVGMHQAWKMTARSDVPISGPYRVGARPPTSPA